MDNKKIEGVITTPLRIIPHPKGNILHGIKTGDPGFVNFGEAYFSTVILNEIKAWKKHLKMTVNLIVPEGTVKFVIVDKRDNSSTFGLINEFTISKDNYFRLTIPPNVWFGFVGIGNGLNLIMNVASIPHDPQEVERMDPNELKFNWL